MAALRPVHFQQFVKIFEQDGFTLDRQVGDHGIYLNHGARRPLVIPDYRLARAPAIGVPVFIIKNLLRTAGSAEHQGRLATDISIRRILTGGPKSRKIANTIFLWFRQKREKISHPLNDIRVFPEQNAPLPVHY